jgi:SNF2 family DNA or RNA helicase
MTRRPYVRRAYQHTIAAHQLDVERGATFAGMGLGKTVETLTSLASLDLVEPGPALVCAPLRVAQSTWPDEAAKWDHLAGFDVVPIVGSLEQRRAALRRHAPVFTTNYEQLPWLAEELGERWPFTKVVADESTRLKSFRGSVQVSRAGKEFVRVDSGVRAKALAKVAQRVRRWINLTGTPAPNGLQDLWGQTWFIDQGQRLGRTYEGFKQRWFRPHESGYGVVPLAHAQREIEQRLADVCLSLDARDHFDLAEPIVNVIRVELPAKARALYRDMEKKMFATIGDHPVEAFNAASRTMKCLQLANGAAYVDEDATQWVEVHDAKIQALDSIVAEAAGAPVLVAYHFRSDLARLQRAFPKARHLDQDPQTIRDWNAGRIPVLLAHPASAGHGLNLQDGGNILAFFGHWWDLEQFQQIVERIGPTRQAQAGHDRPVFIHHIVAAGTVDELVMARRESKREVQDLLLEAMKRRGS